MDGGRTDDVRYTRTPACSASWRAYLMRGWFASSSCKIRLLFTLSPRGSLLKFSPQADHSRIAARVVVTREVVVVVECVRSRAETS